MLRAPAGSRWASTFAGWIGASRIKVVYRSQRPTFAWPEFESLRRDELRRQIKACFATKAKEWAYENEIRYLLQLKDCECVWGRFSRASCRSAERSHHWPEVRDARPEVWRFLAARSEYAGASILEVVEHPTDFQVVAEPYSICDTHVPEAGTTADDPAEVESRQSLGAVTMTTLSAAAGESEALKKVSRDGRFPRDRRRASVVDEVAGAKSCRRAC